MSHINRLALSINCSSAPETRYRPSLLGSLVLDDVGSCRALSTRVVAFDSFSSSSNVSFLSTLEILSIPVKHGGASRRQLRLDSFQKKSDRQTDRLWVNPQGKRFREALLYFQDVLVTVHTINGTACALRLHQDKFSKISQAPRAGGNERFSTKKLSNRRHRRQKQTKF